MAEGANIAGPSLGAIDRAYSLLGGIAWDGMRETFVKLWSTARQTWKVPVSDRRWKWCLRLCQANALLAGRGAVQPSDLLVLADALWEEPGQQSAIRQGLLDLIDPVLREAEEKCDAAEEQWQKALTAETETAEPKDVIAVISEAAGKIKKSATRIEELRDIARGKGLDTTDLEATLARVQGMSQDVHRKLVTRYTGSA